MSTLLVEPCKNMESDERRRIEDLSRRFPSAADHPARVRPARWFAAIMAVALVGLAALFWIAEELPQERREMFALIIAAVGVILGASAAFAPGRVVASLAETWLGGNAIVSLLAEDRKQQRPGPKAILVDLGALLIIVLAINAAFWFLELGRVAWCLGLLVPTMIWAFSLIYRKKFRDSKHYESKLEETLQIRGYAPIEKENSAKFFKHSFLRDDLKLELKSLWGAKIGEGAIVLWGRYVTGGDTLGSGLYCAVEYSKVPDHLRIGELLAKIGTAYFDQKSATLFGTLRMAERSELADLDGLQWQMLRNVLVGRFDEAALTRKRGQSGETAQATSEQLVVGWEFMADWLLRELE